MNTTNQATLQSNQEALEALRQRFYAIATDISLSNKDWRGLMESGALASLSISRYRGHKQLSAQDLGLDQEEMNQVESIVNLGHRLLLPKAVLGAFNSLESNARQNLRKYTLKTPSGYFLPASAYEACAASMQDSKSKFELLVDDLLVELDNYRRQIKAQYETLADQVSKRLYNASLIQYSERDIYAEQFVSRCMATFPIDADLRGSFRFDLRLSFVPMPYSTNQAEQPTYAEPSSDLLNLRRAVIAEQSKIENEEIRGFVSSIQSEVYTLVNESLSNVLESIQDKGFLQSRSTVQLRGLVERLGQLNFWQDSKLEIIKAEITQILDREPSKRDVSLDQGLISAMRDEVAFTLLRLGTVERGDFDLSTNAPKIELSKPQAEPLIVTAPSLTKPQIQAAPSLSNSRGSNRLF